MYPLDHKTKEGQPFWSLPKRPPKKLDFTEENAIDFIASAACLRATIYGVKIPYEKPRSAEAKKDMYEKSWDFVVPEFKADKEKAKAISEEVAKEESKEKEEEKEEEVPQENVSEIVEKLKEHLSSQALTVEEFEKDEDSNFHIDFIASAAFCRAKNYGLAPMDWMEVKIKAGRIIPALATTTSSVAGL